MKLFLKKEEGNIPKLGRLYHAIDSGENFIKNVDTAESLQINPDWIEAMEGAIASIERVAANPRIFIVSNNYVVPVEKAKKTDSKSVEYLLQHTGDIERFTKDNVIPKKVLITEYDDDLAIYENRFVITLINFMYNFLEVRSATLKEKSQLKDRRTLDYTSNFVTDNFDIACDFSVKVTSNQSSDEEKKNADLINRIHEIEKRVNNLRVTPFYEQLCKVKPVYPPIRMTNLLRGQVDYHNCYNLYMFLSNYTGDGYKYQNIKRNLPIDTIYSDELKKSVTLGVDTMIENDKERQALYSFVNQKLFKPNKIKQLKDEEEDSVFAIQEYNTELQDVVFKYFNDHMTELSQSKGGLGLTKEEESKYSADVYKVLREDLSKILDEIYTKYVETDKLAPRTKADRLQNQYDAKTELIKKYELIREINKQESDLCEKKLKDLKENLPELKEKLKTAKALEAKKLKQEQEEIKRRRAEIQRLKQQLVKEKEKKKLEKEKLKRDTLQAKYKQEIEKEKQRIEKLKSQRDDAIKQFMLNDNAIYKKKLEEYQQRKLNADSKVREKIDSELDSLQSENRELLKKITGVYSADKLNPREINIEDIKINEAEIEAQVSMASVNEIEKRLKKLEELDKRETFNLEKRLHPEMFKDQKQEQQQEEQNQETLDEKSTEEMSETEFDDAVEKEDIDDAISEAETIKDEDNGELEKELDENLEETNEETIDEELDDESSEPKEDMFEDMFNVDNLLDDEYLKNEEYEKLVETELGAGDDVFENMEDEFYNFDMLEDLNNDLFDLDIVYNPEIHYDEENEKVEPEVIPEVLQEKVNKLKQESEQKSANSVQNTQNIDKNQLKTEKNCANLNQEDVNLILHAIEEKYGIMPKGSDGLKQNDAKNDIEKPRQKVVKQKEKPKAKIKEKETSVQPLKEKPIHSIISNLVKKKKAKIDDSIKVDKVSKSKSLTKTENVLVEKVVETKPEKNVETDVNDKLMGETKTQKLINRHIDKINLDKQAKKAKAEVIKTEQPIEKKSVDPKFDFTDEKLLEIKELDDLSLQQLAIDKFKWKHSEKSGKDFCGGYKFCDGCDKKRDYPCARALAKYLDKRK